MGLGWIVLWYRLVALGALAMFLGVVGMAFEYPTFGQETSETEEHSRSVDADVRKVGLWSFIGSECIFFATLISTFVVYKARNPHPPGAEILEIPLTSFSTFVLSDVERADGACAQRDPARRQAVEPHLADLDAHSSE